MAIALAVACLAAFTQASVVLATPRGLASPEAITGCPAKAPRTEISRAPHATQTLVPPQALSVLLCRYRGLNPRALAGRLELGRRVNSTATVARLRTELNALPAQGSAIFHCPMDDGSEILAIFAYAHAQSDPVTIGLSGCRLVSNGHLTRTARRPPGPALLAELARLL